MRTRDSGSVAQPFLSRNRGRREMINASPLLHNLVMWQHAGTGGGAGTTWPDLTGTGNNLAMELSGGTTWVQDAPGLVVNTNGIAGNMTAPDAASLDITTELTVSVYIKLAALNGVSKYPFLVGKGTSATSGFVILFNGDDQRVKFYTGNGTSIIASDTAAPVVNQWHHFAGVITAAGASRVTRFYRDGKQTAETSMANIAIGTNNDGVLCGQHPNGVTFGFLNARYGGITVHDRALTAGEIANLYNLMRY